MCEIGTNYDALTSFVVLFLNCVVRGFKKYHLLSEAAVGYQFKVQTSNK
jgi:hypothetical protein